MTLRHYRDHGLYFFEVKIKGQRNTTHKYRVPASAEAYAAHQLPASLLGFCNTRLQAHYGRQLNFNPRPSIRVDYQRVTLVARQDEERITIDNRLVFCDGNRQLALADDRYIIEVKSATGRSQTDRWLQRNHHQPVPRCSKYSMGINLLAMPGRNTIFSKVLRREFDCRP